MGFRGDHSALDNCLVLHCLTEKYTSLSKGTIFFNLCGFQESPVYKRLFPLIQTLILPYLHLIEAQMLLLGAVSTKRGIRQACKVALSLFLICTSIIQALSSSNHPSPIFADRAIPALLYADDVVILPISPAGIRGTL